MNQKKTRIEFIYDQFEQLYLKGIRKDKLVHITNINKIKPAPTLSRETLLLLNKLNFKEENKDCFVDVSFIHFYENVLGKSFFKDETNPIKIMFNYFMEFDPSVNKEYLSWFVNLYSDLIKARPQLIKSNNTGENFNRNVFDVEVRFFEDFGKIAEAIESYIFLKKTNVLSHEQRDINRFVDYNEFVAMVKPYMNTDEGDSVVHTLDHDEIKCIQNHLKFKESKIDDDSPRAELVFENKDYVIVVTHNKEANAIFGKYTTWCTAGTRFSSMFDSYANRGSLFVLIRKGFGSKKEIKRDAKYRMQFHFESKQYMDANDVGINISEFMGNNREVKAYFKEYIINKVIPTMSNKGENVIDFLKTVGFADEIIKILKASKPTQFDFSNYKIQDEYIENIGELETLEELQLNNCGITKLPDSIKNLKNLKALHIRANKNIKQIPDWINKLTTLEILDVANCDIENEFDVKDLVNLKQLVLDCNVKLKKLPKNIKNADKLIRITASNCDLIELPDDLLQLNKLCILDFNTNKKLKKVSTEITKLENLLTFNIDDTAVDINEIKLLRANGVGKKEPCSVLHYPV